MIGSLQQIAEHMMEETKTTPQSTAQDKLIENVKSSLNAVEDLLREAANSTGDRATELRERAMASLKVTRDNLHEAQDALLAKGREAVRATDDYVHDNPWQAVGVAGVVGLLVGLLISRR
jgi:ElaB/YqjD/DUF883 family membrane-anchored ribosome-binding protein